MVRDQHVYHKWHVCNLIFMSCPELPMGIFGVGTFPVWSGCSLINFPAHSGVGSLLFVFILGVGGRHVGAVRHFGMSGCLSVCFDIHTSVSTSVCLGVH